MQIQEVTTTDLADFGFREIIEARNLLDAWVKHGLPKDFYNDEVILMFNRNSGHVFLTNSEFQVAMFADGKLESFYYCSNCGHEGFKDEGFEAYAETCQCADCDRRES